MSYLRLYLTMVISLLILNPLGAQEVRRDTPEYLAPFILPITKPDDPQVMRGHYLVTLGVCHDCHTPKGPDGDPTRPTAVRPSGGDAPTTLRQGCDHGIAYRDGLYRPVGHRVCAQPHA